MITLMSSKDNHKTSKKMLHVPSLSLYTVLEIPIVSMNRSEIKDQLDDWKLK